MGTDESDGGLYGPPATPEQVTAAFRDGVVEFAGGAAQMAAVMIEHGDDRKAEAVTRSIQRMMAGDVRVSGEMLVVLNLIRQAELRRRRLIAATSWTQHHDGTITGDVADFTIVLRPATRGRWRSDLIHRGGYEASWPKWQPTLEGAKRVALDGVLAALDELDECWTPSNSPAGPTIVRLYESKVDKTFDSASYQLRMEHGGASHGITLSVSPRPSERGEWKLFAQAAAQFARSHAAELPGAD
ncbi:MAG TPA: hypothetical protein VF459_12675 [Caulobacteraceae bacterium]